MSSSNFLYGKRSSGGGHGDVYTSPAVVCFMLDKVGYTADRDLRNVHILEPSCGEGEFVAEIAKRLLFSASRFHFDAQDAFFRNVRAYDIDAHKIEVCRERIRQLGFNSTENIQVANFLKTDVSKTDIVIGNPPYVRYENIPTEMLEYCRTAFATFHYRADLYIPFFEKSLSSLKEGGMHCFICSNRWLKNEYGKKLRQFISNFYRLQLLINMEQADAYQEEVLAYPAITLISARASKPIFEYAECDKVSQLNELATRHRVLPVGADWTGAFIEAPSDSMLLSIEQQGFKIGIGVATGADSVFISDKLPEEVETELIMPAINARDLRGNKLQWQGKYLLNPYATNGGLINLDQYPRAKRYLDTHRERLCRRHIACKSPNRWYGTIDRITPSLLSQPKVLLPDISGNTFVFVDEGKYYPLHNIYHITGHSAVQLRILAALLMSDFVRKQLASVSNKMNGGFARWQSQHLRKLRLPDIRSISAENVQLLLDCYHRKDISAINALILKILAAPSKRTIQREYVPMEYTLQFAN